MGEEDIIYTESHDYGNGVENYECDGCRKIYMDKEAMNMKAVRKKILSQYFAEVNKRNKNFELRKDEDDIQIGDKLILSEWNGNCYTGKCITRTVKYVLRNVQEYGLQDGYCIIGW